MAMKRCPDCGEKYSDTYKYCPFCEEEEVLRKGKDRGGRRARQNRGFCFSCCGMTKVLPAPRTQ